MDFNFKILYDKIKRKKFRRIKKCNKKSAPQRLLWAQFDALQMGSGWDEEDIKKPQIMLEDVFGDSHPGSTHLAGLMEQAKYGVFEKRWISGTVSYNRYL